MSRILVCDTETSGLPEDDASALLEFSAIDAQKDMVALDTFVAYAGEIPPEARATHHITPEQVSPLGLAWSRQRLSTWLLANSAPETCWVFHNKSFDLHFLPELAQQPTLCTYRAALHIWPEAPRHSVQVLRYWLGCEPNPADLAGLYPHRSLYDCYCTKQILAKMLETYSLDVLIELSSRPVVLHRCLFGKHRGVLWKDVPKDYMRWIVRDGQFSEDILHTARHHLGFSG